MAFCLLCFCSYCSCTPPPPFYIPLAAISSHLVYFLFPAFLFFLSLLLLCVCVIGWRGGALTPNVGLFLSLILVYSHLLTLSFIHPHSSTRSVIRLGFGSCVVVVGGGGLSCHRRCRGYTKEPPVALLDSFQLAVESCAHVAPCTLLLFK